jgi:molybdopterin/thiamine biosynthesis adenylyltransferase
MVAAMAAVEVIKLITGVGEPMAGRMLWANLRTMNFRTLPIVRRSDCQTCAGVDDSA